MFAPQPSMFENGQFQKPENQLLSSILEQRRNWKTLESGEAIWSRTLEAALIEGLQHYQPTPSKETVMLGRFPRRNQFVSRYIWKKTGQMRTPKQVGSRIQQLRETYKGQEWQKLLFPTPQTVVTECPPTEPSAPPHVIIVIDISRTAESAEVHEGPLRPWAESPNVIHVSRRPRPLASIDPTVTFVSASPICAESHFSVQVGDLVVHSECTPLVLRSQWGVAQDHSSSGILCSSALVPQYWGTLLECRDPTQCRIFHQVAAADGAIIFSAEYMFNFSD
ncbi:hypothetical protein FB45DRAFT_266743 [Roridomyces roridus]|uniref:TEA domain-containing protein n=1 Tax=Roridomyces roridus TaxID=1738132 RepID=A0AAD7FE52_9AGAR|nr:hypothetical protein FB45DRAFT_266743 [Roridomyces roridus]